MRRTSKFSFPIPGRKSTSSKTKTEAEQQPAPEPSQPLSKAQRILGTGGNLNIDSPTRHHSGSWDSRPAPSATRPTSRMSIAISESTEDDEVYAPNAESWDAGEAIHPPRGRLNGKTSSTLLLHLYKGDGDNNGDSSTIGQGVRTEKSSSTLRSYYDRSKAPLAVSQQTSASSAWDLALRKGVPPVGSTIPRSPLLNVDYLDENGPEREVGYFQERSQQIIKKKSSRLDISRLFHKKSKNSLLSPDDHDRSPSPSSGHSDAGSRRLTKVPSEQKLKPAVASPVKQLRDEKSVQFRSTEDLKAKDLYEHYENRAYQNPAPSPRPSARLVETPKLNHIQTNPSSHNDLRTQPQDGPSSMRNSYATNGDAEWRAAAPRPHWDTVSTHSDSSKATRNSRKSVFSSSNLQQNSILSLSSDSDSDPESESQDLRDRDLAKFPRPSTSNPSSLRQQVSQNAGGHQRKRSSTVNSPASASGNQDDKFLTIPLPAPISPRLSGPWGRRESFSSDAASSYSISLHSLHSGQSIHGSTHSGRLSRQSTLRSNARRGQSPSSPVSSRSNEQNQAATTRSSRMMAVTTQEQALLSALRNKRARMLDEMTTQQTVVAHESPSGQQVHPPSPPSMADRTQVHGQKTHAQSTQGGRRESHSNHATSNANLKSNVPTTKGKQRILLYLDRPIPSAHGFDTSEPSPDLSDFLSFGSDEDEESTPRSSWLPPVVSEEEGLNVGRPDSAMEGRTSRSQARLSAVGKSFPMTPRHEVKVMGTERDDEEDGVWGM